MLPSLSKPILAITLFAAWVGVAHSHGPTRQKATEKITINAPADVVWARIKNFDALKDWHPAVAESPADKGNAEGSVRFIKPSRVAFCARQSAGRKQEVTAKKKRVIDRA